MFKILAILLLISCTKLAFWTKSADKSPEEVVKGFLEFSAGAGALRDKRTIQDMCHGELKRIFERMSDEMFTMSYLSKAVTLKEVKVVSTSIDNDVARVRYQVSVENKQGTDTTHETNEREVELTRIDGQWRIDSIRPIGSDQIAFSRGMVF